MTIKRRSPEGQVLVVTWRTILNQAGQISDSYKWILTAQAAMLTLIIVNLDSIKSVMYGGFLRYSIITLIVAIFFATIAYLLSMAVKIRNDVSQQLEGILHTPLGLDTMSKMEMNQEEFKKELSSPFFGPIAWIFKRSYDKGIKDELNNEKGGLKLVMFQSYSMWVSILLSSTAFILIAVGIK